MTFCRFLCRSPCILDVLYFDLLRLICLHLYALRGGEKDVANLGRTCRTFFNVVCRSRCLQSPIYTTLPGNLLIPNGWWDSDVMYMHCKYAFLHGLPVNEFRTTFWTSVYLRVVCGVGNSVEMMRNFRATCKVCSCIGFPLLTPFADFPETRGCRSESMHSSRSLE